MGEGPKYKERTQNAERRTQNEEGRSFSILRSAFCVLRSALNSHHASRPLHPRDMSPLQRLRLDSSPWRRPSRRALRVSGGFAEAAAGGGGEHSEAVFALHARYVSREVDRAEEREAAGAGVRRPLAEYAGGEGAAADGRVRG